MTQLLMTPEGKKIQVDIRKDIRLYDAPCNPPNTGTAYTSGTDLYYHRSRGGDRYYYTHFWSMWQEEESSCSLLTEEEAKTFILERACLSGYAGNGVEESACCELWGEDFLEEDEDA